MTMSGATGLFVLSGVVFVGLGMLTLSGRLRRNDLVGVRISGAVTSDTVWNAAQRASAPLMIATGVISFLLAGLFGIPWLVNGRQPVDPQLLSNCFAGFLLVMSALMVLVSRRAVRRLHTQTDPSVAPWNR
jgi:hypothetical protein